MKIIFLENFAETDAAIFPKDFGFRSTVSAYIFDFSFLAAVQTILRSKGRTVSRKTFREAFAKY